MKNIKLRIVYLILCSALLLFALFMLAVNLIIPAHFVREAKKALISEAEYQNRTIPYTDDGSFFDDGWNDTEEHFLTPSIVFLELDNANQSSGWNRDASQKLRARFLQDAKDVEVSGAGTHIRVMRNEDAQSEEEAFEAEIPDVLAFEAEIAARKNN